MIENAMRRFLGFVIRGYQWVVSPMIHTLAGPGAGCRFSLSCSRFFERAVGRYGALRGIFVGMRRLSRCHPLVVALLLVSGSIEAAEVETKAGSLSIGSGHAFFEGFGSKRYPALNYDAITRYDKGVQLAFDHPDLAYLRDIQGSVVSSSSKNAVWSYEDKIVALKREFTASDDGAFVTVAVSAKFKAAQPKFAFFSVFSQLKDSDTSDRDRQIVTYAGTTLERHLLMDGLEKVKEIPASRWIAATSRYFVVAIVGDAASTSGLIQPVGTHAARISLVAPVTGADFAASYRVYLGPKDIAALRKVDPSLDQTVELGMFTVVAYPILRLLQWIYSFAHNYGVAIILLTLLIKIATYPLTYKSMKSMKVMANLQPEIAALRERYKDNTEQLNRELMTFMRSRGYNPVAGCLPILIQMPVFFALYQVLYSAVELYQAPFFGWIHDLSEKDPFYITPIILTATMYIQQKTAPQTMTDPMQRKIMNFMPVIFGVMMVALPSGLTLYMLVNAIASIGQQYVMNRKLESVGGPLPVSR